MASIGFVSRHCSDLAALTRVVAGDLAHELHLDTQVDLKEVKYYYTETAKDLRVSPIRKDLREAMSKVLNKLREELPSDRQPQCYYHAGFDYMYSLWRHRMTKEAEVFAEQLANNQGAVSGLVELPKKLIGQSEFTLAAIFKLLDDQVLPRVNEEWAEKLLAELKEDLLSTLGTSGVLLFPSAPAAAPPHYSAYLRPFNFAYWGVFNALKFPAAQVPLGLNSAGLPLGLQVVAAPHNEALCLAVAQQLAEDFGGFTPPCKIIE